MSPRTQLLDRVPHRFGLVSLLRVRGRRVGIAQHGAVEQEELCCWVVRLNLLDELDESGCEDRWAEDLARGI